MSSQDAYVVRDSGEQARSRRIGRARPTFQDFSPPARRELGDQDSAKKATLALANLRVHGASQLSSTPIGIEQRGRSPRGAAQSPVDKPDDAQGLARKPCPPQSDDLTEDRDGAVP